MRYIMTKDGRIFDTSRICIPYQIVDNWIDFNSQGRFEIAKEADAIEELCDEFIVWEESYSTPLTMSMREKEKYKQMKKIILLGLLTRLNCWMKLGVWTDKGLIYVAKLNDEVEWELI